MEDSDLLQRLSVYSTFFTEADEDFNILISDIAEASGCGDRTAFSAETFEKPTKKVSSKFMYSMYDQMRVVVRESLKAMKDAEELKSCLIRSQESVIKLQSELLDVKSKQLESVQVAVKSAVQDTVKSEMKSYSQAVVQSSPNATITEESLKKVVQKVVSKEDRSRNVIVFGLNETDEEDLTERVNELFQQIELKPRFEAVRFGRKLVEKTRPVRISLANSSIVHQILSKSKELRLSQQYKTVFIAPDRSSEEQARNHQLVLELKQKSREDLNKRYYIRSGIICFEEKIIK